LRKPAGEHAVDLRVDRNHVIKPAIEVAGDRPQVLRKVVGLKRFRERQQPDQPVHRGRKIDQPIG
jgi:hypothetical protein